jgi:hypothetical protein
MLIDHDEETGWLATKGEGALLLSARLDTGWKLTLVAGHPPSLSVAFDPQVQRGWIPSNPPADSTCDALMDLQKKESCTERS